MKILIGYDGSDSAKAAIDNLKNAGLPANTEALVLMVTENWTMIFERIEKESPEESYEYSDSAAIKRFREKNHAAFTETEKTVRGVADQLQETFPQWSIRSEAMPGFAHWGILEKSREWKPDLIVVGSHGRNLIGRVVLGSSSLKMLTAARCSVRIARSSPARTPDDESPQRIIIGFDDSPDSLEAVEAVARRSWRPQSAVRIVTAIEPGLLGTPGFELDFDQIEQSRTLSADKLKAAGLFVSTVIPIGDAQRTLVEEAERWGADAIFLGAKGHGFFDRLLLGSVSYAVAARAHCSVEVVRQA